MIYFGVVTSILVSVLLFNTTQAVMVAMNILFQILQYAYPALLQ
jgi:hypothetical protein